MPVFATIIAILLLVSALQPLQAEPSKKMKTVPQGLRLFAEFDKDEYFIGENVLVHFVVRNVGKRPFKIETGGDYRGAPRHLRFKVVVSDENGKVVPDPHPNPICFGGIGGATEIKQGKDFIQSLCLLRYARITRPGEYTVKITHDLGWKLPEGKIPWASARVRFNLPSSQQARRVVEEALALPKNHGYSVGSRQNDFLDFTVVTDPIYVDVLKPYAKVGNENAIRGLGSIADQRATAALVELAGSSDSQTRRLATRMICARLPDPQWEKKLPRRCVFDISDNQECKYLAKHGWDDRFVDPVRRIGRNILTSNLKNDIVAGAYILECIGRSDDIGILTEVLSAQIVKNASQPLEEGIYPRPRGALQELMRAVTMLVRRGGKIPSNPKKPGECALYLSSIDSKNSERPASNLVSVLKYSAKSKYPYLRELVFLHMPLPAVHKLKQELESAIRDANPDVSIAAMKVAEKAKEKEMIDSILNVTKTAQEQWQLMESINAAYQLGGYLKALKIAASRLDDDRVAKHCFTQLIGCFDSKTYHGYGMSSVNYKKDGARMKAAWTNYLKTKASLLERDKKVALDTKSVPRALFPTGFQFNLPNGQQWPPRTQ